MSKYIILAAMGGALLGFLGGWIVCRRGLDGITRAQAASVTRQLFIVTLWACIAWISCSYAMAIYAMVILGQVYTLTELSQPALTALTVTMGSKVLSNIFEHNNNKIFGTSVGVAGAERENENEL